MAAQTVQITATPRSELGSRQNRRLRNKGLVPGVVYGHKEAVVPVTLPKKAPRSRRRSASLKAAQAA